MWVGGGWGYVQYVSANVCIPIRMYTVQCVLHDIQGCIQKIQKGGQKWVLLNEGGAKLTF